MSSQNTSPVFSGLRQFTIRKDVCLDTNLHNSKFDYFHRLPLVKYVVNGTLSRRY